MDVVVFSSSYFSCDEDAKETINTLCAKPLYQISMRRPSRLCLFTDLECSRGTETGRSGLLTVTWRDSEPPSANSDQLISIHQDWEYGDRIETVSRWMRLGCMQTCRQRNPNTRMKPTGTLSGVKGSVLACDWINFLDFSTDSSSD